MKIANPMYTDKQNEILWRSNNRDWFMLISHGAVRAGKTVINNDIFLSELLRVKKAAKEEGVNKPHYILAAVSSGTLQTNVLNEITNKYGIEFSFDRHGNFELFGVKVITTFTKTISGLGAIRGMTSYGAYINEASLANKEVFDEIIKRCSGAGARIIADTNPDVPSHWLKKNYIDKADEERIVARHFTIFDNNFLNERYKENVIATTPSGVMTERGIYGRWTAGEGAIYADFNQERHVITRDDIPRQDIIRYFVGVDWGYEHKGVMLVIGLDAKGNYYLIEEHAERRQHIDYWVEKAQKLANRYGKDIGFYADSARPEYVDALYFAGLNAQNAVKDVIPGITEVATLIKSDRFFVEENCTSYLEEVDQYIWNTNGDAPIKEHDDSQDAVRYAIYTDKVIQDQGFL